MTIPLVLPDVKAVAASQLKNVLGERVVNAPAPLVSVAVAATAGICLDRYLHVAGEALAIAFGAAVLSWVAFAFRRRTPLSPLFLWLSVGALAGAWHHFRQSEPARGIGQLARPEGDPVRLRGVLLTSVSIEAGDANQVLRSRPGLKRTSATLEASQLWRGDEWTAVAGRVRLAAGGELEGALPGDTLECQGDLHSPQPPANPGEFDIRQHDRDQGIWAILRLKTAAAIEHRREGWSLDRLLATLSRAGSEVLRERLGPTQADVAAALLLGDERAIAAGKLESYVRTGTFHVLAISGHQLVILCAGLWFATRLVGLSRRRLANVLATFVLAYALLTGSEPPVVRAAVLVCTLCGGIFLRRPVNLLNSLALAWLVVLLINPADLFRIGCQLSFLAVLAIYVFIRPLREWQWQPHQDPLDQLIEQSRPLWQRLLRNLGRWLCLSFLTSLIIWALMAPLLAARVHLFSPIAVLLGPFMIFLTSVALLAGFPLLLIGSWAGPAAAPLAWMVESSLKGCEILVRFGDWVPGGYWYVAGVPDWWLASFHAVALGFMLCPPLRRHWKGGLALGLVWIALGLASQDGRPIEPGLRCTFLSVGHGGCVVLETPDGRVLLYDAGSLAGPEVTQRQIAPFLWSRGITRIDEVLLSHADLDHFNGLPALLDRFAVAQVSLTPSFLNRPEPAVRLVKERLEKDQVPTRVLSAGQVVQAGEVRIEVLHPPPAGPSGNENARSLVLLIRYHGRSVLLTGDLEGLGLPAVTTRPSPRPDVLLAPHHGSATSNTEDFADWASAGLIISSEARPRWRRADPYSVRGATIWRTGVEGAVIVHLDNEGVRAETFKTGKQWRR